MKKFICAWLGECYCIASGLKSLLWACGKEFLRVFNEGLDFLGFVWYTLSRG